MNFNIQFTGLFSVRLIATTFSKGKDGNLKKLREFNIQARKNREIAAVQRKIDEVPSRAELSQYQRRFVELYNQVSSTHRETKQFYTLYNTLDDTKLYLNKEVGFKCSCSLARFPESCRPDMTFAADWVLNNNYLSIYPRVLLLLGPFKSKP